MDVPDRKLVESARRGDEAASSQLVRRHLRKAMAVAMEYVDNLADAEDVVQDAFHAALGQLDRFDAERPFAPWFYTIVRNTARNAIQRRRVRAYEPLSSVHADPGPAPAEEAYRGDLRDAIETAIESLPTARRRCFRLCVVEGLTSIEAAAVVGVAPATVRVHVHKAKHALRHLLRDWHQGEAAQ